MLILQAAVLHAEANIGMGTKHADPGQRSPAEPVVDAREADMLTMEESVLIEQPRDEVWKRFTDPANFAVWMRNAIEGETPGPGGLIGRLSGPILARILSRDMRSNLKRLKHLVESSHETR